MTEIMLIIAIAVMLFPPKELPKLARQIARIYGQVRKTADDFRKTVLEDEDLREPLDEIKGAYDQARFEVRDAERKARQQLAKAQMELRMATARRMQAEREAKADADALARATGGPSGPAEAAPAAPTPSDAAAAFPGVDEDEAADGPVAAPDPRVIAASRAPRVVAANAPAEDESTTDAREGVG